MRTASIALFAATMAASAQASADGKCRALALSGGANYGAWETGVLWGLLHYGEPADFAWDVITGVSAGAINVCATAVFETGDEVAMTELMTEAWAGLSSSDIWQFWPDTGVVNPVFHKAGYFDTSPAIPYLASIIEPYGELKRKFTVAAVDANTGEYCTFDQTNLTFEEAPQACFASGSIPFVFPPQHFKGHVLMDGGTVWNVNVQSAVNQCLDAGFAEEDIIMDVLICGYSSNDGGEVSKSAIDNLMTARQEHDFYHNSNSVMQALREFPDVVPRYYFQEQSNVWSCGVSNYLDFNNSTTWCLQEAGRKDAQEMLALGQDKIQQGLKQWQDSQELQEAHPTFTTYLRELFSI